MGDWQREQRGRKEGGRRGSENKSKGSHGKGRLAKITASLDSK